MRLFGDEAQWMERLPKEWLEPWAEKVALVNAYSERPAGVAPEDCVAVTHYMGHEEVVQYWAENQVHHLVQYPHEPFGESLILAARIICEPEKLVVNPWNSLWTPKGMTGSTDDEVEVWRFPFRSSTQKDEILESVTQTILSIKKSSRLATAVSFICDEFFTNAIYWGPRNITRQSTFAKLRRLAYEYPEGYTSEMFISRKGNRVLLGCLDPFGTLEIEGVVKRFAECSSKGVGHAIDLNGISAGIGLYMAFMQSPKTIVMVQEGQATLTAVEFPLDTDFKSIDVLPKNFHFHKFK